MVARSSKFVRSATLAFTMTINKNSKSKFDNKVMMSSWLLAIKMEKSKSIRRKSKGYLIDILSMASILKIVNLLELFRIETKTSLPFWKKNIKKYQMSQIIDDINDRRLSGKSQRCHSKGEGGAHPNARRETINHQNQWFNKFTDFKLYRRQEHEKREVSGRFNQTVYQ